MTATSQIIVEEWDKDYPALLQEISARPKRIYVLGQWPLPNRPMVGIVGTRRASAYGLEMARRMGRDLVRAGMVVVSGMAAGIDAAAHQGALNEGGATVGVLGHGLKWEYPSENRALYRWMKEKGTLISEFPFETQARPHFFPMRNRIISGLSRGVIVVEADLKSGALITAKYAADQSRDVFAVPGNAMNPYAQGCHFLIKEGAKLVESASDVVIEYGTAVRAEIAAPLKKVDFSNLSEAEKAVLGAISFDPITVDRLVQVTEVSVDQLAEALLSLELKNRIQALSGQRYVIKNEG